MTESDFNNHAQQSRANVEAIQADGLNAARDLIERARDKVVVKLANAPSEFDTWFYTQLQAEADRMLDDLREPLTDRLVQDVSAAADALDVAYEPLRDFGIEVGGVGWTREQVQFVSRANLAERISTAIDGGKANIRTALQQGMLGVMTPQEVQKAIAGNLDQAKGFGPLWHRADMIWSTEVNGTCNRAMIDKSKEIESRSPGKMLKGWMHSGNTRWPRTRHVHLGRLAPQPIDEPYDVGGYAAHGPHDSNLPAEEVIRCGCSLYLVFA